MEKPLDKEKVLRDELERLQPGQFIVFTDKRAAGEYDEAVTSLVRKGLAKASLVITGEQSGELRIYRPEA